MSGTEDRPGIAMHHRQVSSQLDVAAVVVFLRKVIWIVPGFTVAGYRDRLRALHEQIGRDGPFRATSVRFLFEARKGFPRSVPVL